MVNLRAVAVTLLIAVVGMSSLLTSDGRVVQAAPPTEIMSLRTENSKTYDLGGNTRQMVVSLGAVHYKDDYTDQGEAWKDIDLTWVDDKITKAPYELTRNGDKITIKDKRTGEVSTIELVSVKPANTPYEIVVENERVSFRHVLPSGKIPFEASFAVTGSDIIVRASDDIGELAITSSLVGGILTEKLSQVKDKATGLPRPASGNIRIDPTWQVGASSDDASRRLTPSAFSLTDWAVQVGAFDTNNYQYGAGMRFTNITIPQGATINTAYLIIRSLAGWNGSVVRSRISAEDVDDAPTFAANAAAFDARWATRTTARVNWDNIPVWTQGTNYNSPTISTVIQEVVDRPGWVSGNDVVIFWEDYEDRSTHTFDALRQGYSYDGSTTYAPQLVIVYPVIPTITTSAASSVTATTARLNGNVVAGFPNPTVTVYWGDNDGGEVPGNWDNSSEPTSPSQPQGEAPFYKDVLGLVPGTTYYFIARAVNTSGTSWGTTRTFIALAPQITTSAATNIAYSAARLNSLIVSSAGENVEVRFQYNDTVDDFGDPGTVTTTWVGGYVTGNTPFVDLTSLTDNTTHYFRAQVRADGQYIYNGSSVSFATLSVFPEEPTNVKTYTEGTRIVLSWTRGTGSSGTTVRYKLGSYPTSLTDGELLASTEMNSTAHTGLPSGRTYYYSLWGYSGSDNSTGYATILGTTTAGVGDEEREAPNIPALWFISTDYVRFASMPLYDQLNSFADSLSMPRATAWFVGAVLLGVAVALVVLAKSGNIPASLAVFALMILIFSILRLLPLWMLVFSVIFFVGAARMMSHQQGRMV